MRIINDMKIPSNAHITCLSIDCPERRSVCCNALPEAVSGDEGTGYFRCKSCKNEFIGGKCKADKRQFAVIKETGEVIVERQRLDPKNLD